MAKDPQFIDVDKLERELASALEADRKYSRENDAKFRAVHQKVATYEEFRCGLFSLTHTTSSSLLFRDIVKASHLTALDRDDITGRKGWKQPWNPVAAASATETPQVHIVSGNHGNKPAPPLNNVQDFLREWKRLKGLSQRQYQ